MRNDLKAVLSASELAIRPMTAVRWDDFEELFGPKGACGGCWCMLWRVPRSRFESQKGAANRAAMKALVEGGEQPGLLAYHAGRAIGWCAIAPRESYPALSRSRVLKPIDDQPCWSVSCLFVHRRFRGRGVSVQLLRAGANFVRSRGGRIIEGYPVEPKGNKPVPPAFAWTGLPAAFKAAGFTEVARRSPTRPIMRISLDVATATKQTPRASY